MELQNSFELLLVLFMTLYGFIISAFTIGLIKIIKPVHSKALRSNRMVSVIIPVRNEEGNILRILEEIRCQDFPVDSLEVIVTDDHSEDATMSVASRFANRYTEFRLVLVTSTGSEINMPGKKQAIERAVAKAKGEILVFTDADTGRGPHWVSSMDSCFATPGIQMVLGPVFFCNEKNLLQRIQTLEFMGLMGTTAGSAAIGFAVMCNGANLAYRRGAFLQTGGFGENLRFSSGDDQFMMSAIRKQFGNGSLVFNADPLSMVSTEPEATLSGFLHQRIRWVSKSRGYRDPVVITVGVVTYLVHFTLLAGMLSGLFIPKLLSLSLFLWLVKILLEYPMVWIMARYFGKKKLSGYYFVAQVFQLIYVPVSGIAGLFLPYRWKGRRG